MKRKVLQGKSKFRKSSKGSDAMTEQMGTDLKETKTTTTVGTGGTTVGGYSCTRREYYSCTRREKFNYTGRK